MACASNSSDWVVNSKGKVISRGVTSCAGMTAQHVLLAQTKIGFLTGGRGYNSQELSPDEKQSQREEAFARATVALTRAQRFCFIMCPLDMKGIIGAATVVGCLQHGAGVCAMSNSLVALFLWNLKRLHLIIVDLCHPRKTVTKIEKKFHRQITCVRDTGAVSITPIPLWNNEAWRCRYVFGYRLDDSDKPVFLIWPERTESNGFC